MLFYHLMDQYTNQESAVVQYQVLAYAPLGWNWTALEVAGRLEVSYPAIWVRQRMDQEDLRVGLVFALDHIREVLIQNQWILVMSCVWTPSPMEVA